MTGLQKVLVSALSRQAPQPLVDQITTWICARIDERLYRTGMRMPSIRKFADDNEVSRFTVVEAYDRLVARGYLESRQGSGFYIRERPQTAIEAQAGHSGPRAGSPIDLVWLLRTMFTEAPAGGMPASGCLPPDWLSEDLLEKGLRTLSRRQLGGALAYGTPEGYLPLRQQLQVALAELDIDAQPAQIILTAGASQGIDLVARQFLKPGDPVLVDDPGYYVMFGRLAAMGVRLLGVPRTADGPDLEVLARLCEQHKPKLFYTHSVLHNPTGTSISGATAHRVLQLAERYDFTILEDDVFGDLCGEKAHRIAALDQLKRVIYAGSFSKTLGAGLRVGFLACERGLAQRLTDQKMLTSLTSPELGERLVYQILSEGHYRKHLERLRTRLARASGRLVQTFERIGMQVFHEPRGGMFLWARCAENTDAGVIAMRAAEKKLILAPGSLFSPSQSPSPWLRFSVAHSGTPALLNFLSGETGATRRSAARNLS